MRRAPLDNRKIAFGCGRQAIRRLCARPLSWRARSSSRWHVCALRFSAPLHSARLLAATSLRSCARLLRNLRGSPPLRFGAFPPIHLSPRCAIHPRMRLAWLGRNTSRHPARPPRGACRTRAADSLWPRSSLASPRPLKAPAPSRGARGTPYAARCAAVEPLRRQGAAAKLEAGAAGRRAGLRVRSSPKARYAP